MLIRNTRGRRFRHVLAIVGVFIIPASATRRDASARQQPASRRLLLQKEITIGSVEVLADATVHTHGGAFLLDRNAPFVHSIAADGSTIRQFGAKGQGPGELTQPHRMGWRADTLWVADHTGGRVVFFTKEGRAVRVAPVYQAKYPFVGGAPVGVAPDGTVLIEALATPGPGVEGRSDHALVKVGKDGTVAAVLAMFGRTKSDMTIPIRTPRGDLGQLRGRQPFTNDPVFAFDREGKSFAIVDQQVDEKSSSLRVVGISWGGDTLFTRTVRYNQVELDDERFAEGLATLRASIPARFGVKVDEAALAKVVHRPRYLPAVTEGIMGRDGSIWLRRSARRMAGAEYLVLKGDGSRPERVDLPTDERVVEVWGATVWTVRVTEDGMVRLRKYALG